MQLSPPREGWPRDPGQLTSQPPQDRVCSSGTKATRGTQLGLTWHLPANGFIITGSSCVRGNPDRDLFLR